MYLCLMKARSDQKSAVRMCAAFRPLHLERRWCAVASRHHSRRKVLPREASSAELGEMIALKQGTPYTEFEEVFSLHHQALCAN